MKVGQVFFLKEIFKQAHLKVKWDKYTMQIYIALLYLTSKQWKKKQLFYLLHKYARVQNLIIFQYCKLKYN